MGRLLGTNIHLVPCKRGLKAKPITSEMTSSMDLCCCCLLQLIICISPEKLLMAIGYTSHVTLSTFLVDPKSFNMAKFRARHTSHRRKCQRNFKNLISDIGYGMSFQV